jgi:arylsulfatase A-like enzyme
MTCCFSFAEAAEKPNIIFILADDIGIGDVGCYGQTKIQTPNIDRIAGEGVRFMQGYSGAGVCALSRSSLMTGLQCGHCPIRGNRRIGNEGKIPIQAIRWKDWKFVRNGIKKTIELYDLKNDPSESKNPAVEQSDLIQIGEKMFQTLRTNSPDWSLEK